MTITSELYFRQHRTSRSIRTVLLHCSFFAMFLKELMTCPPEPHHMAKIRVFSFGTFLEPAWHLQSTRSRRLLNGFWCFLVQNEEEILLVLFLSSTVYFCWVGNDENFARSKKTPFLSNLFCKLGSVLKLIPNRISKRKWWNVGLHNMKSWYFPKLT